MKKFYVSFVVLFCILLLLPFSVQAVSVLYTGSRFLCFDIFKDAFYSPIKRETLLCKYALSLDSAWSLAKKNIANEGNVDDYVSTVSGIISDLQNALFNVNAYVEFDENEPNAKLLKRADSLLETLSENSENLPSVDLAIKATVNEFKNISFMRGFLAFKNYGIWTSNYLRKFEHKVENENALVLASRPVYQLALWKIFNEPGEKVALGANLKDNKRWLFYRQDIEFLVQPSPLDARSKKLESPMRAIVDFKQKLNAKGIELVVVIVPGKPSIYPELLTGKKVDIAKASHGKFILDSLSALGIFTVDLYSPLIKAKKDDALFGALYLDDDTHWTPRGAELAANVIANKVNELYSLGVIDIGEPTKNYSEVDELTLRAGDIAQMSGLNVHKIFEPQQVVGHIVYDSLLNSPYKDDFRKSKIFILGDSFSRIYQTDAPLNAGWIAHFAKSISRPVASIVSDGGASTLVREKLARKANVLKGKKLLIWEFVERDLRFGAEGWKLVNF